MAANLISDIDLAFHTGRGDALDEQPLEEKEEDEDRHDGEHTHGEQATDVQGVNYGVLLPVWDWMFGTADWNRRHYPATGVPGADEAIVSGGFLAQQVAGLRAAFGRRRRVP